MESLFSIIFKEKQKCLDVLSGGLANLEQKYKPSKANVTEMINAEGFAEMTCRRRRRWWSSGGESCTAKHSKSPDGLISAQLF